MPTPTSQLAALPLSETPLIQSIAFGMMIAGLVIYFWSFRGAVTALFRRLLGRVSPSAADPAGRAPARPSSLPSVMADAEELAQLITDRIDRQAARLEQLIAAADERLARLEHAAAQPPPSPKPQPVPKFADPLSRQVYDLSDRGLPPVEIARQLNQQTGKVELILALRQHA